LYICIF
jgi:hypothetical protein